jgi:hypothetical protein
MFNTGPELLGTGVTGVSDVTGISDLYIFGEIVQMIPSSSSTHALGYYYL